jgi:error-prone DNA polymerase
MATPDLPADPPFDRLRRKFKVLGFLCDRHPMTLFKGQLNAMDRVEAEDLPSHLNHHIRVAGGLITGKTVMTHNDDSMKIHHLEDETGIIESVFSQKPTAPFVICWTVDLPYLIS